MKAQVAMVPGQPVAWCGSDHPAHHARDVKGGAAYICNAWGYCIYTGGFAIGREQDNSETRAGQLRNPHTGESS